MYYCDKLSENIKYEIIDYAKKKGFKIFGAGEYKKWFTETFVDINPFEWVELFRSAQIVFTGTFHGVVFSIKSRKNFYTFLKNPSRIKKVGSLLKQLKIDGREINEQNYKKIFREKNINKDIDYQEVHKNINRLKNTSIDYLKKNIG